jgi:3',5'-nucleoside bisphosphate phosphatase
VFFMSPPTSSLTLDANAHIDLQLHTTLSDGTWTPEQLIDYVAGQRFGLIAITDHERVDTATHIQSLAIQKQFPALVAAEISATWRGKPTDVLCFGFSLDPCPLLDLGLDIIHRQTVNTRLVCDNLQQAGIISLASDELERLIALPSARHVHEIIRILEEQVQGIDDATINKMLVEAGFAWARRDIGDVVEAAHQSGGVLLLAHPGQGNGYIDFDETLLDELRQEVPIDGFEVYHPKHTSEKGERFLAYAKKHNLLVSTGSDSHTPDAPPIPYPAHYSKALLARLGIKMKKDDQL